MDFASTYSGASPAAVGVGPQFAAFTDEFPTLAKAFAGEFKEDGTCVLPPGSLSLFWEGDTLKFCVSPKTGILVCFGTVADASKGLLGIEKALVDGHFEWKKGKKRG